MLSKKAKILSFWGKGGVGKTTLSSITAYYLAKQGYKTLLVTNDLTPSLSDIFQISLNGRIKKIMSSLYVIEITQELANKLWRERFGNEVYEVISSFLPVDESIIDYIAGAPMISDEFILAFIYEIMNDNDYDFRYIVWDTAPAGETLRLIKLEKEVYEHLGQATKLYLSLKSFLNKLQKKRRDPLKLINDWKILADELLKMVSSVNFFAYLVTIPEWLGYMQLKRIYSELIHFSVPIKGIIINQIISENLCDCDWIIKKSKEHRYYIKKIKETYSNTCPVVEIPFFSFEIKGLSSIERLSRHLTSFLTLLPL